MIQGAHCFVCAIFSRFIWQTLLKEAFLSRKYINNFTYDKRYWENIAKNMILDQNWKLGLNKYYKFQNDT